MADLWAELVGKVLEYEKVEALWIPAHKSAEEAFLLGVSREDWQGNARVDSLAKQAAATARAPEALRIVRKLQCTVEHMAVRVVGGIQLQILKRRPRVQGTDRAQKQRQRQAPKLWAGGKKRPPQT